MAPDRSWTSSRSGRAASSRWTGFSATPPGGRPPQTAGSVSGSKRTSRAVDFLPCCRHRPVPWPERRPLPDPTARGRRTTSPASTPTLVGTTDPRLWLGATTPRGLCAPLLIACRSTPAQSASRGKPLHRLGRCSLALCRRTTWTASDRGSSGSGNSVFVIVLALKHKC
jgi:hypothetical protein